jgi:Ca-activated chloride channel homolog
MQRSWTAIVACVSAALVVQGCAEGKRSEPPSAAKVAWKTSPVVDAPQSKKVARTKELFEIASPAPGVAPAPGVTPGTSVTPTPNVTPIESVASPSASQHFNTESYDALIENSFLSARENPLSTFSIDVDTASYAIVRRFLRAGQLPPPGAVRIEELVNYFPYDYAPPSGEVPFSVNVELASCPWNAQHRLARIGLLGRQVHVKERPASNLVFLLDVSGSMSDLNKLPLVKSSMKMLVDRLDKDDRVAIVVYAGASGVVLPSTNALNRAAIFDAIDALSANGSTNAGEGIQTAYKVAADNFIQGGVNRIILCTDGDFNVGITDQSQLVNLIAEKAKSGVALTVLGFGMGNYKDSTIEKLADKGNGNYAYIDTANEARKVLVDQLSGTLVTIAKDVKIQVDFNPARAAGYRLIGYENRLLRSEDFKNDAKDAGEIGAGHTVTAFYEIVPVGQAIPGSAVDPSKYQGVATLTDAAASQELFTVRLRYKAPDGQTSKPFDVPVVDERKPFHSASGDYQFAASVAQFGLLLRDSKFHGDASFDGVIEMASAQVGADRFGYRHEFLELVKTARILRAPQVERPEKQVGLASPVAPSLQIHINPPSRLQMAPRPFDPTVANRYGTEASVFDFANERALRLILLCVALVLLLVIERSRDRRVLERNCGE